ncbi:YqgE/AlgH family protein [Psychrobacter celer]|uniref:YqgE/AlgH family protein n=1 Tax=Psychrobacter celer TaxID=306572 RepID=UPI003FD0D219
MSKANLTHHFLIAAPELPDPRFEQTLIYICRHDAHGALGLMVNRPLEQSRVGKLLEDLSIEVTDPQVMEDVALEGGPMYPEVGFVLHTGQPEWASSFAISENVCITTSQDILKRIAAGQGVGHYHLCLGHASWGKDQLERELASGDWLVCPADLNLLFDTPFAERWQIAADKIGVNFDYLSSDIGHA